AVASLDAPVGDGAGRLADVLAGSDDTQPIDVALAAERRRAIRRSLDRLEGRDRDVMWLRYGLDGHGQRTLGAVGTAVGLSPERVRQSRPRRSIACMRTPSSRAGPRRRSSRM